MSFWVLVGKGRKSHVSVTAIFPRDTTPQVKSGSAFTRKVRGCVLSKNGARRLHPESRCDLLDEYERQFIQIDDPSDPLELLRYLVEENNITARELGEILDVDHSVAARILKGERGITVEHAKNLGARFKVDPKVFLGL